MLCLRSSMHCHRPFNAPRPFSSATDHASTSRPKFQHRVRAISTDRAESSSTRVHASNHVIFTVTF
ncbi:Rhodocytin subunit beta [Gossypium arboreum]|uniref:Rhodocytin subunit beta n=1 Tax=Gossypium arboreum TaxID=29729 RepID=A0A0B0PKZ5_GOSAR|nr:Rhodocytin subunit beta [Gossypium arboreum]